MVKERSSARRRTGHLKSRGVSSNEILTYHLSDQSPLFDESLTAEPAKHILVPALEKYLSAIDCNFLKDCNQKTVLTVDLCHKSQNSRRSW